jgi:hypothetical protein
MNITKGAVPFVILSAHKDSNSAAQNCVNDADVNRILAESPHDYDRVTAKYSGKTERGFIVLCPLGRRDAAYKLAYGLAEKYKQECILYVNERCKAWLDFLPDACSGAAAHTPAGTWRAATPKEAALEEGITIDSRGIPWIAAP